MSTNHVKTWKVKRWDSPPAERRDIELICPKCGTDAHLDIGATPGGLIIAAIGLGLIFDPAGFAPPEGFMPNEIQCRTCRVTFTTDPE